MFVSKLYTDNWMGNRNEENFIDNPNWQQIKYDKVNQIYLLQCK
jgi:hypothetical protein